MAGLREAHRRGCGDREGRHYGPCPLAPVSPFYNKIGSNNDRTSGPFAGS